MTVYVIKRVAKCIYCSEKSVSYLESVYRNRRSAVEYIQEQETPEDYYIIEMEVK
jgi:hypothetical protein